MLNTLTNESLRVRLANIEYVDTKSGKTVAVRQGFFIEDTDDAAKRLGKKELDIPKVKSSQLNSIDAARTELFQYMIGNLDWSIRLGPQKSDCCHNAKLIAQTKRATTDFTPVPYDFDASGLVDASHASPPQSLRVSSVRTRLYRGFCSRNDLVRDQAAQFLQKRSELKSVINTVPGLSDKSKSKAQKYMDDFFLTLSDPKKFEKKIIKK